MLRPIVRPIVRPLVRGVTEPGYGSLAGQIMALFASGEEGAWYDPSDLSTLYQDAAGTIPVTAVGQAVGRMLDKSKGLARGPQRIANWDFSDGITGWSPGPTVTQSSVSAGVITFSASVGGNAGSNRLAAPNGTLTPMRAYEVVLRSRRVSGTGLLGIVTDNLGYRPLVGTDSSSVTEITTRWVTLSGSDSKISLCPYAADDVFEIDYLSVRELLGNHASQPTATARPTLQAGNKIDFDGVDDKLTTTFPDLGTDVTIVRSVPGTGASILTGQTIGAGDWDDNTDHHGLLIINRALTAPETTLVTKWANLRAGI